MTEEKDPLGGLEIAEVYTVRTIPRCQSGDAWMAPQEPGGPGFMFTALDGGDLLVEPANLPANYTGEPEILLLSSGSWIAKMRRRAKKAK